MSEQHLTSCNSETSAQNVGSKHCGLPVRPHRSSAHCTVVPTVEMVRTSVSSVQVALTSATTSSVAKSLWQLRTSLGPLLAWMRSISPITDRWASVSTAASSDTGRYTPVVRLAMGTEPSARLSTHVGLLIAGAADMSSTLHIPELPKPTLHSAVPKPRIDKSLSSDGFEAFTPTNTSLSAVAATPSNERRASPSPITTS